MSRRQEQLASLLRDTAASFYNEMSNRSSLITVTNATISNDLKKATIFITVLPSEMEDSALGFMKRQGGEFRDYIKKSLNLRYIPFFEFEIDEGEKNRQRIDELSRDTE